MVLLILAGITINIMLGDNNIFSKAKKAKEEMDIAKIREKIETIRLDWWAEKKQEPKISINEFWDKLVNEKVIESKDVIEGPEKQENDNIYLIKTLDGYIVEIIEKADGNIIIGKIIKENQLPSKEAIKKELTWENGKANLKLESSETGLMIQYQIDGNDKDKWLTYKGEIKEIEHGKEVYARLWDGTNGSEETLIEIIDKELPLEATIDFKATNVTVGKKITAKVTHNDQQSGAKIEKCKWVYNTISEPIGTDEKDYTSGTFSSNGQEIELIANSAETYYLHVLTTDIAGNAKETISNAIIVEQEEISISERLGYVTEGLILHYDAIENTKEGHSNSTETWYDLTENGNDGILNGCVWQDSYLQLNGSSDGIQVQDKLKDLFKSSNTIEITLSFDENNTRDIIIGNYNYSYPINYEKDSSNNIRIYFRGGSVDHYSASNVIKAKNKYCMSFVMDKSSNTIKVFKNASEADSVQSSIIGSYNYDWSNVWIGRDSRTGGTCLKGEIASVRVYNRNLSENEIEQNYQVDEERFTIINEVDISDYVANGLILHYDGIENTSSGHNSSTKTWYDLSGHGNNGDLYGCTWGSSYLELNGSSDGVQIQNKLKDLFKSSNTIEMTVLFNESNTRDILIGDYSVSYNINYEKIGTELSRVWFNDGSVDQCSASNVLAINNYQSLSYVVNKSKNTIEVFKNASKIDSIQSSIIGSYNYDWTNVWIGRDNRTGDTCLKGRIASVRVYNRNLSESEINQNYQIDKERFKIP